MKGLRTFATPHYTARYQLGATAYEFSFAHNARLDRWYLDIRTLDGAQIVGNRKVVCGVDLLQGSTHEARPAGRLFVVPTGAGLESPKLAELDEGGAYALLYLEPGE